MSRGKSCDAHVHLHHRREYLTNLAVPELEAGWKELDQFLESFESFECEAVSSKEFVTESSEDSVARHPCIPRNGSTSVASQNQLALQDQLVHFWNSSFAPYLVPNNKGDVISSFLELVIAHDPDVALSVADRIDAKFDLCHASVGNRTNLLARHILSFQFNGWYGCKDVLGMERKFLKHLLGRTSAEKDFHFFETTFEILDKTDVVIALWLFLVCFFSEIRTVRYSKRSRQHKLLRDLWSRASARLRWPRKTVVREIVRQIVARRNRRRELWDFLHPLMMMTVGLGVWRKTWIEEGKIDEYEELSMSRPWSRRPKQCLFMKWIW